MGEGNIDSIFLEQQPEPIEYVRADAADPSLRIRNPDENFVIHRPFAKFSQHHSAAGDLRTRSGDVAASIISF